MGTIKRDFFLKHMGGCRKTFQIFLDLIRHGGAPPGVAAFIII